MAAGGPPGWPRDLPPPGTDEFGDRVVAWLLDRVPGDWRTHAVLRRQPQVLAGLAADHLEAELAGLRRSYGRVRATFRDDVPPDELSEILTAVEAQGTRTAEELRQVRMVGEALAGRRWRERL